MKQHFHDVADDMCDTNKPTTYFNKTTSNKIYTELFSDLEDLFHGEKLTKFVARNSGTVYGDGDVSVEIHGLVRENGTIYIVSEKVTRYNLEENVYEENKKEE